MNEEKAIDWEGLVLKVASYKGTMKEFCKENNFTIIEKNTVCK